MIVRILVATACGLGMLSCAEPPPTAPALEAALLPAERVPQATIDLRVEAAAAIDDLRQRILPAWQADSGLASLRSATALAAALDGLATALERREGLDAPVRRVQLSVEELQDAVKGDPGRAADLEAVRMAVRLTNDLQK